MMIEKLQAMTREELVALAVTQGVQVHHKAKPETIIKQIVDKISQPLQQDVTDPRLAPVREAVWLTREQVEQGIAPIKARVPEFETIFQDDDTTVTFKCKGAEDSMSLTVPYRWMMQKAQIVSRGRLSPMGLNPHFDSMNSATGKNAYTNTVLAG